MLVFGMLWFTNGAAAAQTAFDACQHHGFMRAPTENVACGCESDLRSVSIVDWWKKNRKEYCDASVKELPNGLTPIEKTRFRRKNAESWYGCLGLDHNPPISDKSEVQKIEDLFGYDDTPEKFDLSKGYFIRKVKGRNIFVIGFDGKGLHDSAMDRLSIYIEQKTGVMANDDYVYQNPARYAGSDFTAEHFAKFFTEADRAKQKLNSVECRMRRDFIHLGILQKVDGKYIGTADLSIIGLSSGGKVLLTHEYDHAVYWTDERYRKKGHDYWNSLSKEDREFAQNILHFYGGYDRSQTNLLITELLAFYRPNTTAKSRDEEIQQLEDLYKKRAPNNSAMKPYFTSTGQLSPEFRTRFLKIMKDVSQISFP